MSSLSATGVPTSSKCLFEIWLYARPSTRMPVSALGLFGSEGSAVRAAARLRDWLRLGVWPSEWDGLPLADLEELFSLRVSLSRGMGLPLSAVFVTARPYPAPGGDNSFACELHGHDPADPDGDGDHDDADDDTRTPVIAPGLVYENADNVEQ